MAIKKFKIEASEQAKKLARKPVKASDGEWDKAVVSFIDSIPTLPEQGKVISKKYKGFPVVIVGLGDGKCLYNGYTRTNDAASDVQFIRGLIKRGDSPEKATANLGYKTYTRGEVEGACGGKKKSIKSAENDKSVVNNIKNYITDFYDVNYGIPADFSDMSNIPISFAYEGKTDKLLAQVVIDTANAEIAYVENGKRKTIKKFASLDELWDFMQKHSFDDYEAMLVGTSDVKAAKSAPGKKRWGLYSDFGQRLLNETFDSKREAQKAFREYGYTKDSEAWVEEVDETAVGKFDKKPANSACGKKKSVKAGRDKLKARKDWAVDVASRYSLFNGKNGDIENSNNKAELIRKCRRMSDPAWVEDNMLSGIIYNNDAQTDVDNADNPDYKPKKKPVKSSARKPVHKTVKATDEWGYDFDDFDDLPDDEEDTTSSPFGLPDDYAKKWAKHGDKGPTAYFQIKVDTKRKLDEIGKMIDQVDGLDWITSWYDGLEGSDPGERYFILEYTPYTTKEALQKLYDIAEQFGGTAKNITVDGVQPIKSSNVFSGRGSEGRKWVNTELTKDEWAKLRGYLKSKGYKFEPSVADDLIHVECFLNDKEVAEVDAFIDTLDNVESAKNNVKCSKQSRSVKASAAARKPVRKTVKASTEYLESELADKTKYKLIKDAYNENNLTIVKHGDSFYFERTPSEKVANLAIKEIKRIYPELTYIGDIKASLKSSKRSRSVKAAKKDNMNKEAHKWYNISLTKEEYAKFRKFLKENGYKYEPSEEGQNTYVKVYLTKADADKVNKFLDSMDDVESACGGKKSKKTVKASAAAKRRAKQRVACSEDGPLCVCDSCLAGIESHEGRQVIYDEIYSDADYGEPPLICDWCGDEVEKLYQITPGERIESAEQPVKASKYYAILDHYYDEIGRADTEDEARELAKKLIRENDVDHYDIWWVDSDPNGDEDELFDTVYADKPFSVEGYYDDKFRDLSDSETFYELKDALEYAQELLGKGTPISMECENAGGGVEITPDEYEEFMMTEPEYFEDLPKLAEWLSDVRAERMDSNQEPWLDNWQYNTDIGMSVTATNSLDMTAGTDIPKGWNLYGYDLNGEDVDSSYVTFQGDVEKEIRKLFENSEIDTIDLYKVVDEYGTSDYFDTFTRDDINTSTDVKAALGNKNKTDYASNPIYELDKYVKDLAEGVAAAAGITLTYQVSDEAITFIDGDGTAVFIQPISEITPEPDDLEDDIQQLVSAIQSEDWYNQDWETEEDDPDYATRAVQMSVDDELEPVMGEGEDIGFGIDSNGKTIDESTVSELYRMAERDILPNTELAQIDPYVSIDEDSWDFYFGGISNTGMVGVVKFYIHFKLTSDNIDLNEYVLPETGMRPDFKYYTASLDFDIYTENGRVTDVILEDVTIRDNHNNYSEWDSERFKDNFNTEALENYIEKLAAPAAEEIYNAVSNL